MPTKVRVTKVRRGTRAGWLPEKKVRVRSHERKTKRGRRSLVRQHQRRIESHYHEQFRYRGQRAEPGHMLVTECSECRRVNNEPILHLIDPLSERRFEALRPGDIVSRPQAAHVVVVDRGTGEVVDVLAPKRKRKRRK